MVTVEDGNHTLGLVIRVLLGQRGVLVVPAKPAVQVIPVVPEVPEVLEVLVEIMEAVVGTFLVTGQVAVQVAVQVVWEEIIVTLAVICMVESAVLE